MNTQKRITMMLVLSALMLGGLEHATAARQGETLPIPDFTRGGKTDGSHDWTLGPTGARGWMYARKHTADARQILITEVAKGSPADGVLQANDVILGVRGKPFEDDARIQFARAVMVAEQESSKGVLNLVRWRAGQTENVAITIPVMGTYSATAPYECRKSAKIFEQGCEAIAKRGLERISIDNSINALALLASRKPEYRAMLSKYASMVSGYQLDAMATWHYGYAVMFLGEYVIATGDQSVMPGLKRLALESARGQSGVGTWGHKFAMPNGNLAGYGAMNSPGLPLSVAMVVAREAGVKEPALDQAIAKSANFLRWYVNKGAIPYGDHAPWPGHEDNGKCSNAAVFFDLLGEREATGFFARMSVAGYDERERGHTGNYFNILWAMPGVSRCGPQATGAYWRQQAWYYDFARGWDGGFRYQGSPVGEEEHGKYTNWDNTGTYLLAYALPLKSLLITGKKPSAVEPLQPSEIEEVIAAGRGYFTTKDEDPLLYRKRSPEALLSGLSSWSPAVRKRSAQELGQRDGDYAPVLLKGLDAPDRNVRYGAIEALGALGPKSDAAAPRLRALLKDPDPWTQSLAATALAALGPETRKDSLSALLVMVASPNPADPRGMAKRAASDALFGGRGALLSASLDGVDRDLLYPAIQAVLHNEDGRTRGGLSPVYGKLSDRDIAVLLPEVVQAIRKMAPSGEMFADGIRLSGLDLLSRLGIQEGLPLCIEVIEPDRWGSGKRLPHCLKYITRYGTHAKAVLPQLRELREGAVKAARGKPSDGVVQLDKAIAEVEASTKTPALIRAEDFIDGHEGAR